MILNLRSAKWKRAFGQRMVACVILACFLGGCTLTSCVSSRETTTSLPPILSIGSQSQKYNLQLDFMKQHLSGLLVVRRLPNDEIRILASTYFGLSLFDFSLRCDTFAINSCIEPMRKKKVLKLLETDFKNLFLSSKELKVGERNSAFEKRTVGKGFSKAVFILPPHPDGQPERVQIKHPWLRLKLELNKL